jgi:hypothetical protein
VSGPEVVIRVALEERVRVDAVWLHEGDELRWLDWIAVHPKLVALLGLAAELADEDAA